MSDGASTTDELLQQIGALRARIAELEQDSAQAHAAADASAAECARFRALLTDMPVPIVLLRGMDMVAELVNPLYLNLIGRKDIIGKPFAEFLAEVAEQGFLDLLRHVLQSGEPFVGREIPVRLDRDGSGTLSDGWFTFFYQPVRERDGTRSGVFAHVIEVTEQVVARRELLAENQERQQVEVRLQAEIRERSQTEEELRAKLSIIRRQEEAILALATPILQIWDGVLALPLIGTVDSARAGRMMEGLLNAISSTRARFAVLDLTGVDVLDTHAADHLLKLVRAASLLGSRCLLSGISPKMVQTIVTLNLELSGIMSFNTLETALRYAIQHLETRPPGHV
jgi:rsbT co-antagonist protein RsbR